MAANTFLTKQKKIAIQYLVSQAKTNAVSFVDFLLRVVHI